MRPMAVQRKRKSRARKRILDKKKSKYENTEPQDKEKRKFQAVDPFADLREPYDKLYEDPDAGIRRWFPWFR